ncbi:MAG: DapH/DapD/GlmU-related protein [Bacteroidota bacterium]
MFNWKNFINRSEDFFKQDPWDIKVSDFVKEGIFIHPSSTVEEGAVLKAPVHIGPNCFIGAHAYLRGGVYLMGNNSIGPGCELKSVIIFPNTNLAHFNFVGDSILGSNVNMEAGSIVANHFNERTNKEIFPGVTKFGALIGDGCKIGANAVLSPGTILEKNTIVDRQELVNQQPVKNRIQWKDLLVNKAFDLVMLIIGVSIAFQVDNWKTSVDKHELEKFYKQGLLADVNADISEMEFIMKELDDDRRRIEAYLPRMDQLPADSVMDPLISLLKFETFSPSDNTYSALVGSSGLDAFADRDLIGKLTAYYGSYTSIRRFEMVYTNVIFEVHKNFSPYVIYDQGKLVNKSVVTKTESRNALVLARVQLNEGVEDYKEALNRAQLLKAALEKSL